MALKGAVEKAKANAAQGIPELIRVATNRKFSENTKKKHIKDAKYGGYRYDLLAIKKETSSPLES